MSARLIETHSQASIFGKQRPTVDAHLARLRKALNRGHATDPIRTVRRSGCTLNDRFAKTTAARCRGKVIRRTGSPVCRQRENVFS
jgi:hypothetical protein